MRSANQSVTVDFDHETEQKDSQFTGQLGSLPVDRQQMEDDLAEQEGAIQVDVKELAAKQNSAAAKVKETTKTLSNAEVLLRRAKNKLKFKDGTPEEVALRNLNLEKANNLVSLAQQKLTQQTNELDNIEAKIIALLPRIYTFNYIKNVCFLLTDLVFAAYQFKMSGESITDFAEAWNLQRPSDAVTGSIGGILTVGDTFWNLLLFTAAGEAKTDTVKYLKEHGLAGYLTSKKESVVEGIKMAVNHPSNAAIESVHFVIKKVHNLIGASADILGLNPLMYKTFFDYSWFVYAPIMMLADGYYSASVDGKYDEGRLIILDQLKSVFTRMFTEGEWGRSFNVLLRGVVSAAGLRALGFYFIAQKDRELGKYAEFIIPSLVAGDVFWHTLCSRFPKTYEENFGAKDKIVEFFAQMLVAKARKEIQINNRNNNLVMSDVEVNFQALLHAADLTSLLEMGEEATLNRESSAAKALSIIAKKAYPQAMAFWDIKRKEMAPQTWGESFQSLLKHLPIGSLRAAAGGMLGANYTAQFWVKVFTTLGLDEQTSQNAAACTGGIVAGLAMLMHYHSTTSQIEMDKAILETLITERSVEVAVEHDIEAALPPPSEGIPAQRPQVSGFFTRVRNSFNKENVSEVSASVITIMSGLLRMIAQVPQVAFALEGQMDEQVLLMVTMLLLAEQSVNQYEVYRDDVAKSILQYLNSAPKCSRKKDQVFPVNQQIQPGAGQATSDYSGLYARLNPKRRDNTQPLLANDGVNGLPRSQSTPGNPR
jgi:hypothetical protein